MKKKINQVEFYLQKSTPKNLDGAKIKKKKNIEYLINEFEI